MSENQGEDASIDLSVNADEALQVFEQLSAAARDADEQIQQLKQHLAAQVTTAFGAQGQQPQQTYQQASATLAQMDPAAVVQAAPEIAQTKTALAARSADIQAQAMAYAGSTPGLATQPLPDTLAQFQEAMAQREQQQQAQRERQVQQQAAGVERPARYGYDPVPQLPQQQAPPTNGVLPMPADRSIYPAASVLTSAPLATTGDDRLAQALTTRTTIGTTVDAPNARGNGDASTGGNDVGGAVGGVLAPPPTAPPTVTGQSGVPTIPPVAADAAGPQPPQQQPPQQQVPPASVPLRAVVDAPDQPSTLAQTSAPLATTGDDRLAQALSAQAPTPTPATGTPAGARDDASTGALVDDLQRLASAALSADEGIKRLRERLVEQVNAEMGPAGIRPKSYTEAQDLLGRMPAADLAAAAPDVVVTQQRIADRSAEVTGQVAAFGEQAGQATTGQPISQLLDELKAFVQQQQASTASGASFALSGGGAGSGVDTSAALRYGLLPATSSPPSLTPGGDATQTDRFASTMGERLASSMARAGVGMVSGGIQGAANAAGMGATGDLVAGLARPLMAMVSAPLAIAAGVIGGVAGVGLGVNALQSRYAGEERQLAGSVGTSTGATPEG